MLLVKLGHPNNSGGKVMTPQGRIIRKQKTSRVVVGYIESANKFSLEIWMGRKILKDRSEF